MNMLERYGSDGGTCGPERLGDLGLILSEIFGYIMPSSTEDIDSQKKIIETAADVQASCK